MMERLANLSIIEWLAFAATAAVMLFLTIMLPYKIIQEIKKLKK